MRHGFSTRVLTASNVAWFIAACGSAQPIPPRSPVSADPVLSEVVRRSGLDERQVSALLADCNASQQSLYFCAYRDFVAADLTLERVASSKLQKLPECKSARPDAVASSRRSIDSQCEKSAIETYGGGSMVAMARATCAAVALTALADEIARSSDAACAE
jgi:hypothetical protein